MRRLRISKGAVITEQTSMKLTRNSEVITELVGKFKYKDSNMSLMAWNDSFATHVVDVDSHHGKLIELINKICRGIMLEKDKLTLDNTLDELVDFTVMHFGYEESLFDKYGYEDTASHKQKYNELLGQVGDYVTKYKEENTETSHELFFFLENGLTKHILGVDQKYVAFLNGKMRSEI